MPLGTVVNTRHQAEDETTPEKHVVLCCLFVFFFTYLLFNFKIRKPEGLGQMTDSRGLHDNADHMMEECLKQTQRGYTGERSEKTMRQTSTRLPGAHSLSRVRLFATPWTAAHQALLFMGFSRQEYWHGLPCPPPGDLPDPGIEPTSPALANEFFTTVPTGKPFA